MSYYENRQEQLPFISVTLYHAVKSIKDALLKQYATTGHGLQSSIFTINQVIIFFCLSL